VTNPKLFFEKNKCPIFIDELQHAPNLMPNIKIIIDQTKQKPGQFILTGSQMFKFNERIKERLSTRTAVLHLRSLSNSEIQERENFPFVIDMHHFASISRYSQIKQTKNLENILRGSLPDIVNGKRKDLTIFYSSYIEETLYGDINENILKIKDVNKFNNFLKATAIRSGQLVNVHNIAENAEIDDDTAIV
jgi:predicted AAA+ superfamily ATPase